MVKVPLVSDRTSSSTLRRVLDPVLAAVLPPLAAFAVESVFAAMISRSLLFNTAVIIASWVGGLVSGIVATILSTVLLWCGTAYGCGLPVPAHKMV